MDNVGQSVLPAANGIVYATGRAAGNTDCSTEL
jgi:hypothetical protein